MEQVCLARKEHRFMKWRSKGTALGLLCAIGLSIGSAEESTAIERGKKALLQRAFTPPAWTVSAFTNLWRIWSKDAKEAPPNYAELVRARYGLHEAPYPNGKYP